MDNAHKYNIKVVNLSIGTNDRKVNLPLKEAVERLWQMGIVVVAAAGNPDGRNGYRPPPAVSGGVISVGAWEDRSYFLAPAFRVKRDCVLHRMIENFLSSASVRRRWKAGLSSLSPE